MAKNTKSKKRKSVAKTEPVVAEKEGPVVEMTLPDGSEVKDRVPATMTAQIPPLVSIPLPADTTQQEDLTTEGQRRINLIWEYTQAFIALFVIVLALGADAVIAMRSVDIGANQLAALMQLNVMAGLVIGFYFSRTNHAAIGGVGKQPPTQQYTGR